jgi:phosphate transport system protein
MGALAVHVATIARRRYPVHAVADQFVGHVNDMENLVLALARHVSDLLISRNVLSRKRIQRIDAVAEELHRRLVVVARDVRSTQGSTTGVDITLLGQLYERFADHAVQIGLHVVRLSGG